MNLPMNSALDSVQTSIIRQFGAIAAQTPGCVALTIGEPDFNTPECIKDGAKAGLDANLTHYPDANGRLDLRQAICEFEAAHSDLHYTPDEVILTVGATEAVFASLFAILNPGDEVIIPTPAFGLYESIVNLLRCKPVMMDVSHSDFQITREDLEAHITDRTRAIILTSPNNPTGCVLTGESLNAIHSVLADKPIFVLCDDVYRQLTYTDDYRSFANFQDMRDRVIVIQSFSKPYAMTGWRIGYLLADAPVRTQIAKAHAYMITSIPAFVQPACIEALKFDPKDMLETYRRRRDYVLDRIAKMGLPVTKPEGAFYVFPDIREFGIDSSTFCMRMIKEGKVATVPGIAFGTEGFIRISYCYSDEELKEAMDRMEKFICALRNEK